MTENNEVNIPLLRKAVEWVETQAALPADESEWHQGAWVWRREDQEHNTCGTAYCVAGYIGQMLDDQFKDNEWGVDKDGRPCHVAHFAADALGITYDRFGLSANEDLFHADNTAEDVRRIAEQIAGERL